MLLNSFLYSHSLYRGMSGGPFREMLLPFASEIQMRHNRMTRTKTLHYAVALWASASHGLAMDLARLVDGDFRLPVKSSANAAIAVAASSSARMPLFGSVCWSRVGLGFTLQRSFSARAHASSNTLPCFQLFECVVNQQAQKMLPELARVHLVWHLAVPLQHLRTTVRFKSELNQKLIVAFLAAPSL